MSKEPMLQLDDTYYTYQQVIDSLTETEPERFKLRFLENMALMILDGRDINLVEKLELVPDIKELVHFREHFIMSLEDFYYTEYTQEDFNILCKWQELVKELAVHVERYPDIGGKKCKCSDEVRA